MVALLSLIILLLPTMWFVALLSLLGMARYRRHCILRAGFRPDLGDELVLAYDWIYQPCSLGQASSALSMAPAVAVAF
jgi:hypothetical protein